MKTFLKLAVIAAALGLAMGTVNAQAPAAAPAAAATSNAAASAPAAPPATAPTPGIGQPADELSLQRTVTPIGAEASHFHDVILMPLITVISGVVLFLLLLVVVRYRRGAHPTPSRNTHNTTLEIIWTLVPVLILVAIAVPSIRLLAHQYDPPRADLTVKAIGNQWYWEYDYPDNGVHLVSNILPDAEAARRHEPRQLGVDERMVVPVGAAVKVITTSNDVIHSFGVPALWVKMDAVPGRLNETWFRAEREGVYYGVCYELCGARHGFMPIAVEVVSPARFTQWLASRGGHPAGAHPAPAATPAPAPPAAAPATTNSSATR